MMKNLVSFSFTRRLTLPFKANGLHNPGWFRINNGLIPAPAGLRRSHRTDRRREVARKCSCAT